MTSKHTPGPWSYWPNSAYPEGVISQDSTARHIARPIVFLSGETGHNAYLIAAAPDLLAALEAASEFIRNGIELGYIDMFDAAHEVPAIIETAINKAKGV